MPYCCVPLCTSHTGRTNKEGQSPKISFHQIPKEPQLLKQFAVRIRRDIGPNFTITKNTVICSRHYNVEDFYCYNPPSGRRELKPGVLPSVFDFKPKPKQRKPPRKRRSCKETSGPCKALGPCERSDNPAASPTVEVSEDQAIQFLDPLLLELPPESTLAELSEDPLCHNEPRTCSELPLTEPRDRVDEPLTVLEDMKKEKLALLYDLEKEKQARKNAEEEITALKILLEDTKRELRSARTEIEELKSCRMTFETVKDNSKLLKLYSTNSYFIPTRQI